MADCAPRSARANHDPQPRHLAAAREEQEALLEPDPWEFGLSEKNRKVLETLIGYSHEQGLIKKRPTLDELFLNASQERKRAVEHRI